MISEKLQENGVKEETQEQNGENNQILTTDGITNNENNLETQQNANQPNANLRANNNTNSSTNSNSTSGTNYANNTQTNNAQRNTTQGNSQQNNMQGQQTENQNSNNQGNNNSQGTDNIEGSTIRRVTEGELVQVTDDRVVRWTPINIEAENATQKDVDEVVAKLTKAVEGLEEKVVIEPEKPTEPEKPETKPEIKPETKPEVKPEEKPATKPENKKDDTVKTGDPTSLFGLVSAMALSLAGYVSVKKKKD